MAGYSLTTLDATARITTRVPASPTWGWVRICPRTPSIPLPLWMPTGAAFPYQRHLVGFAVSGELLCSERPEPLRDCPVDATQVQCGRITGHLSAGRVTGR